MVIVRLRGGLGNQLFQYAAAKALSLHKQIPIELDTYTYTKNKFRKLDLEKFNIDAPIATRKTVHQFTGSNFVIRYLNKQENYFHCPKVFAQPHYHYYDDFFSLPDPIYLTGYWQSEKYFLSIRSTLEKQYTLKNDLDIVNQHWKSKLELATNSVSIHIRRGDYLLAGDSPFFYVLDLDYYTRAIARIKNEITNPKFYFFSDDIEWCKKHFTNIDAEFIDHNQGEQSYKDMLLMNACHHHIIANSSFSWWGAWLNNKKNKIVIAPQRWFKYLYENRNSSIFSCRLYNTKDVVPSTWITI